MLPKFAGTGMGPRAGAILEFSIWALAPDSHATRIGADGYVLCKRGTSMPEISRFLGIVITMYFNDHEPPHFHVRYGDWRATFAIDAVDLLEGRLPPRVLSLVSEWAALHRFELRRNWTLLATEGKFRRIDPLV